MATTEPVGDGHRGFVRAAREDLARFRDVANTLVRYGFREAVHRTGLASDPNDTTPDIDVRRDPVEAARRFKRLIEELGPTFVKVGQILSTRPDLLPPPFIVELRKLQDRVQPVPFDAIRTQIEGALGEPIDRLYATFDPEPLASASMAQTHLATLADGTEVVVKVQRPGITETIRSDLDLLHLLARLLESTVQEMEMVAPGAVVRALDDALSAELDFRKEAANLREIAQNFAEFDTIRIPEYHATHSCRTVLTMGRIRGRKIDALESGCPLARKLVRDGIDICFKMVFEDGVFHGDPHPGNVFVTDDEKIGLIDFGMCGRLTQRQRDLLISLIVSVLGGDVDGIARSLLRMGRPLDHVPMRTFKAEISDIRDRYLRASIRDIDMAAFIEECMDAAQRYRIRVSPEYAILIKAAATIEGILRHLDPEADLVREVGPVARKLLADRYSPERVIQDAATGVMTVGHLFREVPEQLSQILMDVESGAMKFRVESENLAQVSRELNAQTTRALLGVLSAALLVAAPLWHAVDPLVWRGVPILTILVMLVAILLAVAAISGHLLGGGRSLKLRLGPLLKVLRGRFG